MAGNYNYDSLMGRNQFYDEYAPVSGWAAYNRANFEGYKDEHLFTSPGYRKTMVDGHGGGGRYHDEFNNAYSSYTNVFNQRKTAIADAQRQQQQQNETANRLRIEQEQRLARIEQQKQVARSGNAAVRSSLQVLGQEPTAGPTAQMGEKRKKRGGVRQTSANISRGSASSRGTNLSI